jgi:hypothetical protein
MRGDPESTIWLMGMFQIVGSSINYNNEGPFMRAQD